VQLAVRISAGNIVTGNRIWFRRMGGGSAYALTVPFDYQSDGHQVCQKQKVVQFGWFLRKLFSLCFHIQFWLNVLMKCFKNIFGSLLFWINNDRDHFEQSHAEVLIENLQKKLASRITNMVHGEKEFEMAIRHQKSFWKVIHRGFSWAWWRTFLQVFDGVPQVQVNRSSTIQFGKCLGIYLEKYARCRTLPQGEARKMIQGGGVSIN